MKTEKAVKSAAADTASKIHNGVDVAEEKIDESVDAFSARLLALEAQLRENGERLLADARAIGNVASEKVRMHPLAAFGVAFVAGITVARLLRK